MPDQDLWVRISIETKWSENTQVTKVTCESFADEKLTQTRAADDLYAVVRAKGRETEKDELVTAANKAAVGAADKIGTDTPKEVSGGCWFKIGKMETFEDQAILSPSQD